MPGGGAALAGAGPHPLLLGLASDLVAMYQAILDIHAAAADFVWALRAWVLEIAPVMLAAHARQALRDAVRELPFISGAAEERMLRWLREHSL